MYFDPVSSWLVALIADGIVISGERSSGKSAIEYNKQEVDRYNRMLNGDIRRVKKGYGLALPELALDQIKRHIQVTQNSFSFKYAHGTICIDIDNQDYIIELLEACEKEYRSNAEKYASEEYRTKANNYKWTAIRARRERDEQARELEEKRIAKEEKQNRDQMMSNIFMWIGLFLLFFLVVLIFTS